MALDRETIERVVPYCGSLAFGGVGAEVLWVAGIRSFGPTEALNPLSFFLSMFAFIFAMAIPFAIPAFFRSRAESEATRQLLTLAGFAFAILFFLGVGLLGIYVLGDLGIDTPYESIAFFDAMTGLVYGGMIGYDATSSAVDWHRHTRTPDVTF